MKIDAIADAHLKPYGRSLPPDDELRLVAKLIDASVREHMCALGADKAPTPLNQADMQALAEVMAKCAIGAVRKEMAELREQIAILTDNVIYMRNIVCRIDGERTQETKEPKRSFWR